MALNVNEAPKPASSFEIAQAGTQMARLVQVVSLGRQEREFKGEPKEPAVLLNFTFELPSDTITTENGEKLPRWISMNRVTFSNNDKSTLVKITKALDPANKCGGDLVQMLGLPCFLTIEHQERKGKEPFAKVTNITGIPVGVEVPPLVNEPSFFDFDEPNKAVFDELPMWLQGIIKESLDYEGSETQRILETPDESDNVVPINEEANTSDVDEEDRPY